MYHFGLIGHPVGHSLSKEWMTKRIAELGIDADYRAIDLINITDFNELLHKQQWSGLNVTIPYKRAIIPYLDHLSPTAQAVGAVNTIIFLPNGQLIGDNTDVVGFQTTLIPHLANNQHYHALILGTGGASKAVEYVLYKLGIDYAKVSRNNIDTNTITYDQLTNEMVCSHHIIINTTPLGMWPNTNAAAAIPYHSLTPRHILYDLVYNPLETLFLLQGKAHNATTISGIDMLYAQAEASLRLWINAIDTNFSK